jgi:hypothetical protein
MDQKHHLRLLTRLTMSSRRRPAFAATAQLCVATAACALWVGVALPGLALVPGIHGNANASVAISLQSALLGIDDGSSRSTPASVRAALRALGLDPNGQSLSTALLRVHAAGQPATLLAQLDDQLRALRKSTTHPSPPPPQSPTGALPQSQAATSPQPQTPPTQAPATADPLPVADPSTPTPTLSPDPPKLPAPKLPAPPVVPVTPVPPVTPPAPPHVPAPPGLAIQTIVFTSTPPQDAIAGGAVYVVSATAGSGMPVVFTGASTNAGVCTVTGSTVALVGAGTCTINANQPGDTTHPPAPQVQQSFSVRSATASLSVQSINFTSTVPTNAVVAGPAYTPSATASSGLPVVFSAALTSAGVCTLANGIVSFVSTGICRLYADQDGDDTYLAAPQLAQTIVVGLASQAITFTSTPPVHAGIGDPAYLVTASTSSGLPVVFSAEASSAGVCTVSGSSVTPVGAGTCLIDANQFGNGTYQPVAAQQSFFVAAGAPSLSVQSIQLTSTPPAGATVGGPPYSVNATASSGLAVRFSADATSAGVCTVSGSTASFVGLGTCTIDLDQAGDASYLPAPQVQQSFTVGQAAQAISFNSTPPPSALVGDPAYTVSATASSGLAVTFAATPGSAGICTVSGATVSIVGAGTCTIDANQAGNGAYQAAAQVQQSFVISAPSASTQSINFTSTAPSGASVGGAPYTVSATASSGLGVRFTIAAGSAGVCTLAGSTVSLTGAGTCTIDANQAGDVSYLAAAQVQQSFSIALATETISFTSTAPSGSTVGDPAYTVSAIASSGLAVSFGATPGSAGACTVSGATVSIVGAGTCTINANQAGNGSYQAAAQVQQSFVISAPSASTQSINFTSSPPSGATVGGASYTVSATASSGLTVVFSADATSTGICTVSGSTVSPTGAGTCTIDANQAGDASYLAAPQAQQLFTIALATQTISFTSTPPSGAIVGDPAYTVSATATSGLAATFSADASSAGICTVSGSTVTIVATGTCTINADQAGDGAHQAAPQVQQSFGIGGVSAPSVQSVNLTSTAPSGATIGGPAYTVTATTSSGLAATFTIDAGSAGICTVSGATVSFTGAGTCTINANQAGNASYLPAPQVQQTFAVALASQTISFTSSAPPGGTVGDPDYTVSATATSGLPVAFSAAPGSAGICTVSGSTVSFTGAGTCTIRANQAGNATYNAAPQVQQSFVISAPSASTQSINFTSTAPAGAAVGGPTYTVTAATSSGLAATFTIDAGSAGVCTIAGSTVSLTGAGTCTIDANQAGNASYLAAPQVQQSFTIGIHTQTISFTSTPPGGATVGGATYTVSATATSGLAVALTAAPTSAGICTVSGSTVTFTGAGTCTINANQAGNGAYQAAVQVQQSFAVVNPAPSKSVQSIAFTSTAPAGAVVSGPNYSVTATASSGLAVTFSIAAGSAGVCTLAGATVSLTGAGTCTINADQAGNGTYLAAPQVQQSFTISLRTQTISFASTPPAGAVVGGPTYTVSATASTGLAVTFTIDPASAGVCALSGATVSMIGGGTCTVNANQAGNSTYQAAQVQQSFSVSHGSQTITFTTTPPNADRSDPPYMIGATANSGLAVVFTTDSSSNGICSVSGNTVSFDGIRGTCIVYGNQPGNAAWLPAPQVQQVFQVKNHTQGG